MGYIVKKISTFFALEEAGSDIKTEVLGGMATFLTMAYIIFVNPAILINAVPEIANNAVLKQQFFGAFMVATVMGAAASTFIMGLVANYPFALAPGMGLNAYFTYTVCLKLGIHWRVALAAVFVEGIIFILVTLLGIRKGLMHAIPRSIKFATTAGIGLFLTFIGLKGSGFVIADPNTFVTLGNLNSPQIIVATIGFLIIAGLHHLRFPGSILVGILTSTFLASLLGITHLNGIIGSIPDISPTFLQLRLSWSDLISPVFWIVVITFFFADFFDATGTLAGLANAAGLTDKEGNLPRSTRAYLSDGIGIVIGALFGTSAITTFGESATGMAQGARTGLASVVTAFLLLISLFFSPLAAVIPTAATAPALIFIGSLMVSHLKHVEWDDMTEALPAFMTMIMMPLTYSIANGIAFGLLLYPFLKLVSGRIKEIKISHCFLAISFLIYLVYIH